MPKFIYSNYALWADLCSNFYTSNMPYGVLWADLYAQILILLIYFMPSYGQICVQIFILHICLLIICPLITRNIALELLIIVTPHCINHMPQDLTKL